MADLTSTGLEIRTQDEILTEIENQEVQNISDELDLSTSTPLGQVNRIFARQIRLLEEALQMFYANLSPAAATGTMLERICALTGTYREAASRTRVAAVVNLETGTYAIGSLVAAPDGRPMNTFSNVEELVVAAGPEDVSALFDATETGPVACAENALVISGAVSGWNSIVENAEGVLGRNIETDAELRLRRAAEIANPGSASVPGIAADILNNVPDVISAYVVENSTDATVDSIPPHSIEVIVYGPSSPSAADDLAVAEQIFASKAAGIGTYGNTDNFLTDSQGYDHEIFFTRPVVVPLEIAIEVDVLAGEYAGDTALAEAIAELAADALTPGLDLAGSQIAAWAHTVPGVLRVTDVTIEGGASFGVYAITSRQIASVDSGDVTVTSTSASP